MVVATAAPLLPFICSCDKKHSTAAQQGIFGNKGKAGPVLLFLKINGNAVDSFYFNFAAIINFNQIFNFYYFHRCLY